MHMHRGRARLTPIRRASAGVAEHRRADGRDPPPLVLWRGGCASATRSASEVQQRPTPHQPTEGSEHEMSARELARVHARLAERRREGAARARERVLAAEVVLVVGGEGADVAEPDRRARGGARARRLGRVGGGAVRRALVAEDAAAVAAVVRPPHQVERPLAEHAREHEVLGQPRLLRVPRVVRRERRLAQLRATSAPRPSGSASAAPAPDLLDDDRVAQLDDASSGAPPLLGGAAGVHRGRATAAQFRGARPMRRPAARGSSAQIARIVPGGGHNSSYCSEGSRCESSQKFVATS